LTKFKKDATVWFQQCECNSKEDCSDVVAIYFHNDSMATKNIMVKPDKAWRPNYKTQKLEAILPESVKCGSMASEEDAGGP
jgi:SET domain-containing protein